MFWKWLFKKRLYVIVYEYYGIKKQVISARDEVHALNKFHRNFKSFSIKSVAKYELGEEL